MDSFCSGAGADADADAGADADAEEAISTSFLVERIKQEKQQEN